VRAVDDDERDGVALTNLDQPLFDGAGATKRDLVDYLDAMSDRIVPVLQGRPSSAPDWLRTVSWWAETSKRTVAYALCDDRRSLLWFANQRAVEYHPALVRADRPDRITHLVLDLDPPEGAPFAAVVTVAHLVRQALGDVGLSGALKTSGAKGVHVFVPIDDALPPEDAAAALRALAARVERLDPAVATTAFIKDDRAGKVFVDATRVGGATVVAAYSPRARAGVPVSFPLGWDDLDRADPRDFTIHTAPALLDGRDPWAAAMSAPQAVPAALVDEGRSIPVPRVAAMHEGRRRAARARKE